MALARFSQEPPSEVYQDSTFTFAVQSPIDQFHRIGINQKNSFALAIVESAQYIEDADDPPARGMPQKGDTVSIFTNRYEREFRFELAITAVGTFNAVIRIYKYGAAAQDGVDCVGTVRSRLITVFDPDPNDDMPSLTDVSSLSEDGSEMDLDNEDWY